MQKLSLVVTINLMAYLEIKIPVSAEMMEIIVAELSYLPYNSFEEKETEGELMAYILEEDFVEEHLQEVLDKYNIESAISIVKMENKNWNEEWEKNFEPTEVSDNCRVRATFHEPKNLDYEIIINPRMAFGTGHHSTTQLMMRSQFNINHKNKTVIDAGTGTAVLAILAQKLGATSIQGNDIDDWAYDNAQENCKLNDCQNIKILLGPASDTYSQTDSADILLANINKNVLLDEIPTYSKLVSEGGHLLLSGFYEKDVNDVSARAAEFGFNQVSSTSQKEWACILFVK